MEPAHPVWGMAFPPGTIQISPISPPPVAERSPDANASASATENEEAHSGLSASASSHSLKLSSTARMAASRPKTVLRVNAYWQTEAEMLLKE
jgi:hypothetical protein